MVAALIRHGVRYVLIGSYAAIAQGVDLPMTDLDIVPDLSPDNRARLIAALHDLHARERRGEHLESAVELFDNPDSLTETTFWTFATDYGDVDVVLRPAGFPRGYEDLLGHVVIVGIRDESDPDSTIEAVMADLEAVYRSKRQAGRQKDIEALARFVGIHQDPRESARRRYREDRERRSASGPDQ